jgi:exodeoxyribonuclease V alpha subunit
MTSGPATDAFDVRLAARATGTLATFNRATVLHSADVHVAATLGRLAGEHDQRVLLAAALAVRAVRHGSVCIDLGDVRATAHPDAEDVAQHDVEDLPWPPPDDWYAACAGSPLVAVGDDGEPDRPLRLVDGLLYLDRYWRQEQLIRADLDARARRPPPHVDPGRLRAAVDEVFPDPAPDHQRLAGAAGATGWVTVVAGGPGTGKTTTVARLLDLLHRVLDPPPRVALAAPTGKAAARLQEAVGADASTMHRLLGSRPDSHSRFRYDRHNRLPYDVVVVDETSMVSLTLMARLLEAVRPDARLVLVGDPDQLASVEAGAVLGDLVHRPARAAPDARASLLTEAFPDDIRPAVEVEAELRNDVVRLRRPYRFGSEIDALAEAVRAGDPDRVLEVLRGGGASVSFIETSGDAPASSRHLEDLRGDVAAAGRALHGAARRGDVRAALAALDGHRLLCAHREGPHGVSRWADQVERWLRAAVEGYGTEQEWYVGRPLIVTANDYDVKLYNGDTGAIVDDAATGPVAAFGRGGEPVLVPPNRLSAVQTLHAMTIHRSQGSQFDRVSVLLPPADSRLLTRELFYTAVTRAQRFVRVLGTEAAVRDAVTRPIVRASGLRRRAGR